MSMQPVRPVKPAAAYIGGKVKLAHEIVRIINQTPHKTYAECFVGMGGVFLRRESKPPVEVLNDYSRDVSNFFRILQRHYVAFMDELKWKLTTRDDFQRLIDATADSLTDLERAARFLYLQRTSFGGKVSGRNFGVSPSSPARFDVTKLSSILEDVHTRLSSVTIECLDYKKFIERYDYQDCLFYLDPPYYGCEDDYGKNMFDREEFTVMASFLSGIRGRFILSINDTPEVRGIFKDFHLDAVGTTYTIAGGDKQSKVGELLITNYVSNPLLV